jgi:hypothetical protein
MTIAKNWPKWRSHKIVQAIQIDHSVHIDATGGAIAVAIIQGSEEEYEFDKDFVHKHPLVLVAGSWLVCYEDGYISVSPQFAFTAGYTRV